MYLVHHNQWGHLAPLNLNIGINMYYMGQHELKINPKQHNFTLQNPEEEMRRWAEDNEPEPEEPLSF